MIVPYKHRKMEVLDKESFKNCINAILISWDKSEDEERFKEKVREIEKKYGKRNTEKVIKALIVVLKEKIKEK